MFFICGVNSGEKQLNYNQLVVCSNCGGYGRYQVYMTYMCLSLFFIPVLKWGRKYYVRMTCCGTLYELNSDMGKRIVRGEAAEITSSDLTMVQAGRRNQWQPQTGRKKVCRTCGYETEEDFVYCPKCGERLE